MSNVTAAETDTFSCSQGNEYEVANTLYRKVAGTVIFVAVWPFIVLDMKWLPIGRPAAALIGGALMVFFIVVPQDQVFSVIGEKGNLQTICLLIGMMLLSYYYDREGLLQTATLWIFGKNKPLKHILWKVCACSAFLSAIITNDATCLVVTPLLLMRHNYQGRSRAELPPLLLGIATSANIGSAATFFGNPQNAFIAANAEVSLLTFFVTSLPAAIIGMVLSTGLLYIMYLKTIFGISLWRVVTRGNQREPNQEDGDQLAAVYHRHKEESGRDTRECSLAVSRTELRVTLDQSSLPRASSRMSRERERMYSGYSISSAIPSQITSQSMHHDSRDTLSLPRDFHSVIASEQPQGAPGRQYGATDALSASPEISSSLNPNRGSAPGPTRGKAFHQRNEEVSDLVQLASQQHGGDDHALSCTVSESDLKEIEEAGIGGHGPRTWRTKLFIAWLIFVTVAVLILLAIPPPPLVSAEFNLGLVPVGAGVMTMLVDTLLNRHSAYDAITKIDWPVLMMFWGLFIWLKGFENTGFPRYVFQKLNTFMDLSSVGGLLLFTVFVVVGSNILSNVPLVILVVGAIDEFHCGNNAQCPTRLTGVLLAWVSTIAGNFTLIGSVANLIVAEKGRTCSSYRLTFWEYLRFGLFSTLVVLFVGLPIVYFGGKYVKI